MANDSRSRLGSKREVRPGVWEVAVTHGRRADGSKRRKSRTVRGTEADADRALVLLADEMGRSAMVGETGTVSDFWPRFMRRCEAKGLTNSTISTYTRYWRNDIEPTFGGMRWDQIRYGVVQDWLYTMPYATAKGAARTLKRIINCAVDVELIDHNPLDHRHLDYPVRRTDPMAEPSVMWGAEQVMEAMRRLRGCPIEALYLVLVGGGLRVEEGLALEWPDLSFERYSRMDGTDATMCHARVTKAWTEADGLKGTKNEFSRRVVPVPDPFASRLAELAGEGRVWPRNGSRARVDWRNLFAEPPKVRCGMTYKGILHGMPKARLKDMRSVHETLMQESGTLDTINARLHGRTNVQTGYSHYLRPSRALDEAAERYGESLAE